MTLSTVLVLLVSLLSSPARAARTIVVAADGSGDSKTVAEAEELAKPGDTLVLRGKPAAGEWAFTARDGVAYRGEDSGFVSVTVPHQAKGVRLSGLALRSLKLERTKDAVIEDCLFSNAQGMKPYPDAGFPLLTANFAEGLVVRRSRFRDSAQGIELTLAKSAVIEENVFTGIWGMGVLVVSSVGGASDLRIARNTFSRVSFAQPGYDGRHARAEAVKDDGPVGGGKIHARRELNQGAALHVPDFMSGLKIENNVFAFNDRGLILGGSECGRRVAKKEIRANLFFGNARGGIIHVCGKGDGVVIEDRTNEPALLKGGQVSVEPRFADPEKGDFRLAGDSSLLGAFGAPEAVAAPAALETALLSERLKAAEAAGSCARSPSVEEVSAKDGALRLYRRDWYLPESCCAAAFHDPAQPALFEYGRIVGYDGMYFPFRSRLLGLTAGGGATLESKLTTADLRRKFLDGIRGDLRRAKSGCRLQLYFGGPAFATQTGIVADAPAAGASSSAKVVTFGDAGITPSALSVASEEAVRVERAASAGCYSMDFFPLGWASDSHSAIYLEPGKTGMIRFMAPGRYEFKYACENKKGKKESRAIITVKQDLNARVASSGGLDTELLKAVETEPVEKIAELIARGAVVHMTSKFGFSPLMVAAARGRVDVIKLLLDKGADVNHVGGGAETALIQAATNGKLEAVLALLDAGADTKPKNKFGHDAAGLAKIMKHHGIEDAIAAHERKATGK